MAPADREPLGLSAAGMATGVANQERERQGFVLQAWWTKLANLDPWTLFWLTFGFAAQGFFAARFVWQWLVSEKKGRSTVPVGFWILSLLGGGMLLVYACHLKDPVFIAGQGLGLFIYVRNLMLIRRRREAVRRRHPGLRQRQVELAVSQSTQGGKLP